MLVVRKGSFGRDSRDAAPNFNHKNQKASAGKELNGLKDIDCHMGSTPPSLLGPFLFCSPPLGLVGNHPFWRGTPSYEKNAWLMNVGST